MVALGVVAVTYFTKRGNKAKTDADAVATDAEDNTREKTATINDVLKEPVLPTDKDAPTKARQPDRPVVAETVTPPQLPAGERWHNQRLPKGITETVPAAKTFAEESRDDAWAEAAEKRLTKRVTEMATGGVALEKVECRTSMCRLDVDGSADVVVTFIDKMIDDSATRSDVGAVTLGGDSSEAAMFLRYKR